jgi:hypothetical protein
LADRPFDFPSAQKAPANSFEILSRAGNLNPTKDASIWSKCSEILVHLTATLRKL